MKPYLVKTPKLLQRMFPQRVWAFSRSATNIYLTFDDGPIPEVTPWVLEELRKYNAKATFFCIGDNIYKYPDVYKQVIFEGHSVGNHTVNHLKGTQTSAPQYLENIQKCNHVMQQHSTLKKSLLFRPPYGKMTSAQSKKIAGKKYQIVMWDVLSGDFDTAISEEKCLKNVLKNIQPGSIVVFHDSLKAEKKLRYVLPKVLASVYKKGWTCNAIT